MALRQVSLHIMATTLAISQNCISLVIISVVATGNQTIVIVKLYLFIYCSCNQKFAGLLLPQFLSDALEPYVKSTGFLGNRLLVFC